MLDCEDTGFLDFLTTLLQIDPELRPTAQAALEHPWLRTEMPFEPYAIPPEVAEENEGEGGGGGPTEQAGGEEELDEA